MTKITITKQVKEGESVSIQSTPASGYAFDSYSGNINGTTTGGRTQENGNNPLSFNATTNSNIDANFKGTNEGRIEIRWYNSVNEPGYGPITRTSASLNATNLRGVQRISDYGNAINVNGTLNSGRWTGYYEGIITGFPISAIKYVGFREEGGTYPGSSRSNVYYADFSACTGMTVFGNSSNNQQFYYHNTIETVKLPSSIESIYFTAFTGSNIKTLYIYATTPPSISGTQYSSGDIIFSGCSNLRRIYVPAGSVNAYKSATAWSYYSDKITAIIDVSSEVNPVNSGTVSKAASETSELSNTQSSTLDGLILTASGNSGYSFSSWKRGATVLSTSNPYTLYSPDNINGTDTIIAEFLPTYTISASVEPSGSGTISGSGTYSYGDSVSLVATTETGYEFSEWTENGTTVSSNSTYSFTATQDRTLVANFQAVQVDPLVIITNNTGSSVKLKNNSDQVYTWNLDNGTNNYYGTEPGFELNNLKSIYEKESNNYNTSRITSIDISSTSITEFPYAAFYSCNNITSITLPANTRFTFGDRSLYNCTKLNTINNLGEYVLGNDCFYNIPFMYRNDITIPSINTVIPNNAFKGGFGYPWSSSGVSNSFSNEATWAGVLRTIYIPYTCTSIGEYSFAYLGYVNRSAYDEDEPEDATWAKFGVGFAIEIGDSTHGSSLGTVGDYAFYASNIRSTACYYCSDPTSASWHKTQNGVLGYVKFYGTTPPTFSANSFYPVLEVQYNDYATANFTTRLIVPSASLNSYKTAINNAGMNANDFTWITF